LEHYKKHKKKPLTDEHKNNIGKSHKGKKLSEETKMKISKTEKITKGK
jgi:hypothetical protein